MKNILRIILLIILLLVSCTGLSPEPKHATFIFFKNNSNERLSIKIDHNSVFIIYPRDESLRPVEPGMHIIEVSYGPISIGSIGDELDPDSIYITPCEIETLSYEYGEE